MRVARREPAAQKATLLSRDAQTAAPLVAATQLAWMARKAASPARNLARVTST